MRKNEKRSFLRKRRAFVITVGVIVLLAAALLFTAVGSRGKNFRKADFVDNSRNEPYAQGIPLEEMDFRSYAKYVNLADLLVLQLPLLNKQLVLPCDVHYYAHKDDSEPAVTLAKGTEVYIIPASQTYDFSFNDIGYGLRCWPDYEKGWRYGQPFSKDGDAEPIPPTRQTSKTAMYFVKTAELEKIAHAFWKENKAHFVPMPAQASWQTRWIVYPIVSALGEWNYPYTITRFIDMELYRNGAFCSKELS